MKDRKANPSLRCTGKQNPFSRNHFGKKKKYKPSCLCGSTNTFFPPPNPPLPPPLAPLPPLPLGVPLPPPRPRNPPPSGDLKLPPEKQKVKKIIIIILSVFSCKLVFSDVPAKHFCCPTTVPINNLLFWQKVFCQRWTQHNYSRLKPPCHTKAFFLLSRSIGVCFML